MASIRIRSPFTVLLRLSLAVSPALAGHARSQTVEPPGAAPASRAVQAPLEGEELLHPKGRVLELSLPECLSMARRDNLGLRSAALDQPQAEAQALAASGFFEPAFFLSPRYQESERPSTSTFLPESRTKSYGFRTGFQGRVLTGATYDLSLDYSYRRFEDPTVVGGVFGIDTYTQWTALAALTLRQPLLKGAWIGRNRTEIAAAELGAEAAGSAYKDRLEETLLQVTQSYWELVFARENYKVRQVSLEMARDQLEITEQRIKAALAAEVERVADQADIAARRLDLIGAANLILAAEDALKALIFPFREDREWATRLVPTSPYEAELDLQVPPAEEAAALALGRRHDLQAARAQVEKARVLLDAARTDLWPQLDLEGGYSVTDTDIHTTDFARNLAQSRYPTWSLALLFSIPLGNKSARGEFRRAEYALEQAERELRRQEVAVWREVRDAVRDLESLGQEIAAGREAVRLAETNLDIEEEKFKVGKTINFEVQRRNEALAAARSRLIRSLLDFRIAAARLTRATGERTAPAGR